MSATFPFQTLEISRALLDCRRCPRLVAWREEVGRVKRRAYMDETYWAKPYRDLARLTRESWLWV